VVTDAAKEPAALIFSRSLFFHLEDGGSRISQDIDTYLPDYMVSHVRRHSSS
jgi:hypothetical protein